MVLELRFNVVDSPIDQTVGHHNSNAVPGESVCHNLWHKLCSCAVLDIYLQDKTKEICHLYIERANVPPIVGAGEKSKPLLTSSVPQVKLNLQSSF